MAKATQSKKQTKRGPGRPLGSKNKTKLTVTVKGDKKSRSR